LINKKLKSNWYSGFWFLLLFFSGAERVVFAQKIWNYYGEPEKSMTVSGIVKGDVGPITSGVVKIFRNGAFYHEVFLGPGGRYDVDLPFGDEYEMEFSVPGCVTKRIQVETNVEKGTEDTFDEPLSFNMALPKATGGPLDEAYEKPVSRLYFNRSTEVFERDMVTEKVFKDYLAVKQIEQKRWLEEQKELAEKAKEEAKLALALEKERMKGSTTEKGQRDYDSRTRMELEFLEKQKQEQQKALDKLRQKEVADSIFLAQEAERLKLEAERKEAERLANEKADDELWRKLNDKTAEMEAKRKREMADSLFIANQEQTLAASSKGTVGGGKGAYYTVNLAPAERYIDVSAVERNNNWQLKIKRQREELIMRKNMRMAEKERIQKADLKYQSDLMRLKAEAEQRRLERAKKDKEAEDAADAIRKQRVQESLNKKVVTLVAYSTKDNKNAKYYGYVNFGDGKGPLELTESEYRAYAAKYNQIYNKEP
jgi:membrane protein involved in colicin uptake